LHRSAFSVDEIENRIEGDLVNALIALGCELPYGILAIHLVFTERSRPAAVSH